MSATIAHTIFFTCNQVARQHLRATSDFELLLCGELRSRWSLCERRDALCALLQANVVVEEILHFVRLERIVAVAQKCARHVSQWVGAGGAACTYIGLAIVACNKVPQEAHLRFLCAKKKLVTVDSLFLWVCGLLGGWDIGCCGLSGASMFHRFENSVCLGGNSIRDLNGNKNIQ